VSDRSSLLPSYLQWMLRALLVGALSLFAVGARAQPSAADLETARALFNEGMDLRDKGDAAGALEKIRAAHSLGKTPVTGLELGRTLMMLGKLVEARNVLVGVPQMAPEANETQVRRDARQEATRLAEELRARVPSVRLVFTGVPAGMQPAVQIDGLAVPAETIGYERKLDPGAHTIVASLPTQPERRIETKVELKEREIKSVQLDFPPDSAAVQPPGAAQPTPPPLASPEQPPARKSNLPLRLIGFGTLGLGLAVGGTFGALALSKGNDVKDRCDEPSRTCPTAVESDLDSTRTLAMVSNVGFVVAALGGGIVLTTFLMDSPPERAAKRRRGPTARPVLGVGYAGVRGNF
jgi:hypothetical protein